MDGARYSIFAARAVFDARLTNTAKIVLAALGTYTDKEGWCHPSQATLAARLGIGRPAVSASINMLVDCGYVMVRARTASGRGKIGNEYRVVTDLPNASERPMSSSDDNGKTPDVAPERQRKGRKGNRAVAKPMSSQNDNGPMSSQNDMPMSSQNDIVYTDERPQTLGGKPKGDLFGEPAPSPAPRKPRAPAYPEDFEAFWRTWPKNRRERSDKRTAMRRWADARMRWDASLLMRAAENYLSKPDTRKEDWRYCCLAEVFLNGKLEAAVEAVEDQAPEREEPDDGNGRYRAACMLRLKHGRWLASGPQADEIPHVVQREYPQLFSQGGLQ